MIWLILISLVCCWAIISFSLSEDEIPHLEPYTEWWPKPEPPLPEPWRERYEGIALEVPSKAIAAIADPDQILIILQQQQDYEEVLKKDILTYGLTTPLIIVIDNQGQMTLQDGYHRLVAVGDYFLTLPVLMVKSERLRCHGTRTNDVFELFFR